jgi:hypothetical protein
MEGEMASVTCENEIEVECDRCDGYVEEVLCEDCRNADVTGGSIGGHGLADLCLVVIAEQDRLLQRTTLDRYYLDTAIANLADCITRSRAAVVR